MMWILKKKKVLKKKERKLIPIEIYQYFSTKYNNYYIKNYFSFIFFIKFNFFIRKLKYFPLSSKLLNWSKEAAEGLKITFCVTLLIFLKSFITSNKTSFIFLNNLNFI